MQNCTKLLDIKANVLIQFILKMKIKILGCYGNYIGKYRATSFLINDTILLDAGTVTEALDDEALKKIKQVLITHTHIDHVKGLFPFVDELAMMGDYSIELISVKQILEIISQNLLNNLIWPDFTVIPSEHKGIIKPHEIPMEQVSSINSITVEPVLMTHTVFTVGYIVKEGKKGFMFTADTGPTKRFWEVAGRTKGIEFIISDVSFPNRLSRLAKISGHMTTAMLAEHIDRYGLGKMPIYVTHIKPIFLEEIHQELDALNRDNIKLLKQGSTITV